MKNLEELKEYCIKNIGMELMRMEEDSIATVKEVIATALKGIETDEGCKDNEESMREVITELEKFDDYNCLYSVGYKYGGSFDQGYVIIDANMDYIGFVRTI